MTSAPAWIRLRRAAGLVTIAVLALSVGVQAAGATVVEKGSYAEQYTFVDDSCGFPLEFVGEVKARTGSARGRGRRPRSSFSATGSRTGTW